MQSKMTYLFTKRTPVSFSHSLSSLPFRILNYTPDLKKSDVDRAIRNALNVWSDVTPLIFKKLYQGNADIMISFGAKGKKLYKLILF